MKVDVDKIHPLPAETEPAVEGLSGSRDPTENEVTPPVTGQQLPVTTATTVGDRAGQRSAQASGLGASLHQIFATQWRPPALSGRKLIGVFGGSFDPPTRGHLGIIEMLANTYTHPKTGDAEGTERCRLDEVRIVPCFQHMNADKRLHMAPFDQRLEMLQATVGESFPDGKSTDGATRVIVEPVERDLGGISETFRTIQHLRALNPEADFVLFIGQDVYDRRHEWPEWDNLCRVVDIRVLARGRANVVGNFSSTGARTAIADGDSSEAEAVLRRPVRDYIESHPDIVEAYRSNVEHKRNRALRKKALEQVFRRIEPEQLAAYGCAQA